MKKILQKSEDFTDLIKNIQSELREKGRFAVLKTDFDQQEYEDFLKKFMEDQEELKKRIDKNIMILISKANKFDLLDILAKFSIFNLFSNPETYVEAEQYAEIAKFQYLYDLFTSVQNSNNKEITEREYYELIEDLETIWGEIIKYYLLDAAPKNENDDQSRIRFLVMMSSLNMRGDTYPQHMFKTCEELFSLFDDFFRNNFGFSIQQFISFIKKIRKIIQTNINKPFLYLRELHNDFKKKSLKYTNSEEFSKFWEDYKENVIGKDQTLRDIMKASLHKDNFHLKPEDHIEELILELLSLKFGENHKFLEALPNWKGWPLNPSITLEHPVIKYDEKYYFFGIIKIIQELNSLIEVLIKNKDNQFCEESFYEKRDDYLEKISVGLLKEILKGCDIYPNVYYYQNSDGETKRFESDGIILLDEYLFILEAKAGKFRPSSRRGSIKSLHQNINKVIGLAFKQGERTRSYILNNREAIFYDEEDHQILTLEAKDFRDFFLVNITYDSFFGLSSHIPSLKQLGLSSDVNKFWSCYFNDLRIIAEINNHPSLFVHYLIKRTELNKYPQFQFPDELDIYMNYLKNTLNFDENQMQKYSLLMSTTYTADLDQYYIGMEAGIEGLNKPKREFPKEVEELITHLEEARPKGYLNFIFHFLDAGHRMLQRINEGILNIEQKMSLDGKSHFINTGNAEKTALSVLGVVPEFKKYENSIVRNLNSVIKKYTPQLLYLCVWIPPLSSKKFCLRIYEDVDSITTLIQQ